LNADVWQPVRVAFNEIRRERDTYIGERLTALRHERFRIRPAPVRRLQQVLQEDVGRA
jgi:hypothetical protein